MMIDEIKNALMNQKVTTAFLNFKFFKSPKSEIYPIPFLNFPVLIFKSSFVPFVVEN